MSEVEFFVLEEPFSHVFAKKCNDTEAIEIRPKNPHDQVFSLYFFVEKDFNHSCDFRLLEE